MTAINAGLSAVNSDQVIPKAIINLRFKLADGILFAFLYAFNVCR